ncbi:MAG: hypothetical protein QOJ02_1916 [Acidobacteriota bacterium]|jgi:uncharacterized repeat protein (TIGR01451 family)|nr:hypothetical protein [Acidobacteriota bacterium]
MLPSQERRNGVRPLKLRAVFAILCLLSLSAALPLISHATRQSETQSRAKAKTQGRNFVPGEILVRFRAGSAASKQDKALIASVRVEGREIALRVERFGGSDIVDGLRLAHVAPEDTLEAIAALNARPDVLYAEPNFIRRKSALPNDARFSEQWGLKNTGQSGGKVGADIHAEQAWNLSTGSRSVVVGVIDEGIDINHEDLKDNIWRNPGEIPDNGVDDDSNGLIDDINGWDFFHNDKTVFDGTGAYPKDETDAHGTHVAGTIGAAGNNTSGVVGVNWQVSLMSLKVLGPDGGSSSTIIQAYNYARMMRALYQSSGGARGANVRVLNNSYGGSEYSQAELDGIRALNDSDILFVAAAGNESRNNDLIPAYPSSYISPNLISVAASSRGDLKPGFTNFGQATVSMAAPGDNILSTTPNNTYDFYSGTSMAAPHVSGAAALVCAASPNVSMRRLRSAILYSGDVLDVQMYFTLLASGRRLNAFNALQNINEADTTPPAAVGNFQMTTPYFRQVFLSWFAPGDDGNTGQAAVYELRFSDTDISTPAQFELARPLAAPLPTQAGSFHNVSLEIPWRHPSGFIAIRAIDNVGNAGPITQISITVGADVGDPYIITESAATALSTGGTPLALIGDDEYKTYNLPFAFPFFGRTRPFSNVTVSTNGNLFFGYAPTSLSTGRADDVENTVSRLGAYNVIAGLWDDLRTDKRPGDDVYVVKPDADRIIFRWQAVTYDTPLSPTTTRGENPVNFEIELRRDGTIQVRYGDGNQKVFSVVGAGGGMPDSYVIDSHTAKFDLMNLTNAPAITYAFRPLPPASADLEILSFATIPNTTVTSGQALIYNVAVRNRGPNDAAGATVTATLPAGATYVSCSASKGTCAGPAPGASGGTVTANLGSLSSGEIQSMSYTVQVNAADGTSLNSTSSVSSSTNDPHTDNNSATATTNVTANVIFPGGVYGVTAIAAGQSHSLALKETEVWAWGDNSQGQLGNGTTNGSSYPVLVSNLFSVRNIAAGGNHNVALKNDGTVWTWGDNRAGQLGDGTNVPSRNTPVQVRGLTNVIDIAAGEGHTLALKSDSTIWAWGSNSAGQLGIGSSDDNPHPVPVQVGTVVPGITRIMAGGDCSFAIVYGGATWAWGANSYGKLGDGTSDTMRTSPTLVAGTTNIRAISARSNHVIALRNDNSIWTWGINDFGQLGLGASDALAHPTPSQVTNLAAASAAAGGGHTLISQLGGPVWVWGKNYYGQLGTGSADTNPHPTPVALPSLTNVAAVAAGNEHSLALLSNGTIRAWGNNSSGQLGDGTLTPRSSPVAVGVGPKVATPTFSPDGGSFSSTVNVTVNCATSGAVMHYSTNGSIPTESDPLILPGGSVSVNQEMTLKVRAWQNGQAASDIKSAYFSIVIPIVQFAGPFYSTNELNGSANITVYRNTITSAATVNYATSDNAGLSECKTVNHIASSRCDYATTVGTLRFAVGESSKTISIPIVDDSYAEGDETFKMTLSNPTGANLGPYTTVTITILDHSKMPGGNPIEQSPFFVRQHYIDFLGREPDPAGFQGWQNSLNNCKAGDTTCDRIEVSSGFFRSAEFQERGYFTYRFYSVALGRKPDFAEFIPDLAKVSGFLTDAEKEANKVAFVDEFMTRTAFKNKYDSTFNNPTSYVDALLQTAGLQNHPSRAGWIDGLNKGTLTRAQVLRQLAESVEAYSKFYNEAFVVMQYFGYLRRDPDAAYLDWIKSMNQNGDYRSMIDGFVNSTEYRQRFGP